MAAKSLDEEEMRVLYTNAASAAVTTTTAITAPTLSATTIFL